MRPAPGDVAATPRPRGGRAGLTAVLAATMAVSVYSIPALAVLGGLLIEDLGISRTQFGVVVTTVAASNAGCAVLAGRLVDRIGGRRVVLAVLLGTSASAALLAAVPSFAALLVVAVLAGAPNGAGNPATNKVIAVHVPGGSRGSVVGTKQAGVQAGIFLVGVTLPPLAVATSWRWSLLLVVALGLLGALAAARVLPVEPRVDRAARAATGGPLPTAVRWLSGYALLMGAGGAAVTSFLPLYATESVGLTLPVAGAAAATVGVVGMAARIALGRHMERLRHVAVPLAVIGLGSVASVAAIVLATRWPWLLWPGVALAGVTIATWNALTMLAAITSGPERTGRATGLVVFGFMGGYALSPALFGAAVDRTGGYLAGWSGAAACFLAAAALMLLWERRRRAR